MNISISILDAVSLIGQLIMIGEVKLEIKCVIITIWMVFKDRGLEKTAQEITVQEIKI